MFESHAEFVGPDTFSEFCLPYLKKIAHGVKEKLAQKGIPAVPMVMILFSCPMWQLTLGVSKDQIKSFILYL